MPNPGLNEMEIETVRKRLDTYKWVEKPEIFLKTAEKLNAETEEAN